MSPAAETPLERVYLDALWRLTNVGLSMRRACAMRTGVNPMITVEAMAYMVAEGLAEEFRKQRGQAATPMDPVLAAVRPEE